MSSTHAQLADRVPEHGTAMAACPSSCDEHEHRKDQRDGDEIDEQIHLAIGGTRRCLKG